MLNLMVLLTKKPFSFDFCLSEEIFENLCFSLPKIEYANRVSIIDIEKEREYFDLVKKNWIYGSYQLNNLEIEKLSNSKAIDFIKIKLKELHDFKKKKLSLKSSCIFYPAKCKYSFKTNNQKYLYHKYHLDSGYRIKALILLKDSKNEYEQFSYIKEFPESKIFFFIKRYYWSQLIVFLHRFIYIISLKLIKFSGQPPVLPIKYYNPNLYKKYNSLKKGSLITFNNMYPHSSHNGFSVHKTPMLQLVFEFN